MARVHFVKKAQKTIYNRGIIVEHEIKKGKHAGQSTNKLDRTQPHPDGDSVLVHAGQSYYWWQFMNGPKRISKTRPRQSQLTQSEFMGRYYELQERLEDLTIMDLIPVDGEASVWLEEYKQEWEELRDETQEKLDNMPENLQYSSTAELLQERIDACDSVIDELDSIDLDDYEEPEDFDGDEPWEEWAEEKLGEIQSVSFNL